MRSETLNAFALIGDFEGADGGFSGMLDFGLVDYAVGVAKAEPEGAHDWETGGDDANGGLDGGPHAGVDELPCEIRQWDCHKVSWECTQRRTSNVDLIYIR